MRGSIVTRRVLGTLALTAGATLLLSGRAIAQDDRPPEASTAASELEAVENISIEEDPSLLVLPFGAGGSEDSNQPQTGFDRDDLLDADLGVDLESVDGAIDTLDLDAPNIDANVGAPDVGAPDVDTPNINAPDARIPDVGVPNPGTPDLGVPDIQAPSFGIGGGQLRLSPTDASGFFSYSARIEELNLDFEIQDFEGGAKVNLLF